jgi:hypothetical protein
MTESTTPAPPNLDDSIRQLKEVSQDVSQSHPKKIAELYVAAIGLLCHLKVDQQTIFRVRCVLQFLFSDFQLIRDWVLSSLSSFEIALKSKTQCLGFPVR